jgi:hypothetical protein
MGGQTRFDSSDRDDAGKMRGDLGRRTAMLNRVQQIVHKRAIYAPPMQRAFINGQATAWMNPRSARSSAIPIPHRTRT